MGYTPIYFQRPMWLQSAPNVAPSPEMEIPHPRVRMNNNKNQKEQNYYSSHPDYNKDPMDNVPPGMKERPGMREMAWRFAKRVSYNEAVVPHTVDLGTVKGKFELTMPENSVGILRLKSVK